MKLFRNPFILGIIFFLFSFLTLSFFFFSASSEIRIIQNDKLQLELEETSLQVEHNFHEIESRLTTLAYFIQSSVDDAKLLDLFIKVDENYQPIESVYFGKPDKTMINSTGFVPGPGFDLTTRLWYQLAIQSDDIIFTPAFINATNDRVIVTLAKAVYNEDTLLGVIASDVDIRTITAFVGDKKIGNTGFAFLFDINNSLLAYPNIDTSTIEIKNISVYEPNLANLNSNNEFFFDFTIQGIIGVLSTKLIADENYRLGVFLPLEEYSKGLDTLKWVFVGLSVMISLVGVFVFLVYYNRVNKPLNHLIKDIQSIDISTSFSYRLPEPMKDDYLSIRQAVNNLLETNDFYFSERQKVLHKLTLENQRVFLLMQSAADIIFEIDLNLRFVSVFGRGLATLKMKSSDFLGKTVMDVFGANGKSRELAYRKALEGIHNVYDWSIVVDNEVKYFEASISPMYDENKDIIGAVGITRDVTEYTYRQKEIEYLSIHDFLSGLYNRRHFVEMMAKLDQPQNYPIGMMMIDLNGLKIFNDAYGHITGDKALLEVANVLKALVKSNEIVFRIGGDEFAILFVNCSFEYLQSFKDKVLNSLHSRSVENISLSVAIGFDIKNDESHNFEEVMKNAENQMYRNKVTEGKSVRNSAIKAILKTLTDKFEEEKTHSNRVSQLCKQIGEALNIRSDDLKELEMAGLFHDIGKISIPDEILHKPGRLTVDEFEIVKSHTENGYHILRAADEYSNLAEYALTHHEHWDGKGYPRNLKGEDIPLFSRIIGIADAFEAMTSDRVYRKKLSVETAVSEIVKYSGTQFDPKLAKIFVENVLGYPFK